MFYRIIQISAAISFLSFCVLACVKDIIFEFQNNDDHDAITVDDIADRTERELFSFYENGITVDDTINEGDSIVFVFSNEQRLSFHKDDVRLISIIDDILPERQKARGVNEGYEYWSFSFDDGVIVSIEKTLFAKDPDIFVRGINHRGFSVEAPENTLPAYRLSKLKGFNYVETDVHFTKDGVPVLLHDATIDRTSDGVGYIKDILWNDVRKFDFGEWKSGSFVGTKIPSFRDFCELCSDIKLNPYIELKAGTKKQVASIVSMVNEFQLTGRAVYISFSAQLLKYVLDSDPSATVGLLVGSYITETTINAAKELQTNKNHVFIDAADCSDAAVSLCKQASMPLEVWTIDSEATILSLSSYISGVTSNKFHAGRIRMK